MPPKLEQKDVLGLKDIGKDWDNEEKNVEKHNVISEQVCSYGHKGLCHGMQKQNLRNKGRNSNTRPDGSESFVLKVMCEH